MPKKTKPLKKKKKKATKRAKKSGKTSKEIGNELETALEYIENDLFARLIDVDNSTYTVEAQVTKTGNGSKKEIDLYITVYENEKPPRVFLYECKNWKKNVPAKEIIVFQRKMSDCNAEHGYFVAKTFEAGCYQEEEIDPKLTLILATDLVLKPEKFIGARYGKQMSETKISVEILTSSGISGYIDDTQVIDYNGEPVAFGTIKPQLFDYDHCTSVVQKGIFNQEGPCGFQTVIEPLYIDVRGLDLSIYGSPIVELRLGVHFGFYFTLGKIKTGFKLKDRVSANPRGRYAELEIIDENGKSSITKLIDTITPF